METAKVTNTPPNIGAARRRHDGLTLEPAFFLMFSALSLSGTIWQNQIIYQTCTVQFGFHSGDCGDLGTHNASKTIETIVQPYAANIFMAKQLIELIGPAVIGLFVGPWSDRFGRKPVIVTALSGYFLCSAITTIIGFVSLRHMVNPWVYLLAYIPIALSGSYCVLLSGTFCYISDITSPENRSTKISILQGVIMIGALIGGLSSSYVLSLVGTVNVFLISSVLMLFALLYTIVRVEESLQDRATDQRIGSLMKLSALFDISLAVDMIRTCFRRREHFERSVILITMTALVACVFVMNGSETVFYMFVREKFEWTIWQYNAYSSTSTVIQVVGNLFGVYVLVKYLGIGECNMAIVAFASFAGDYAIQAIASQPWHLYAGISVGFVKFVGLPICRAILANNVPADEIGKIFALTTSFETIVSSLAAAPLYSYVYASTLAFYPGAFNMISAAMCSFCLCLMIVVKILLKRNPSEPSAISYGPISSED